MKKFLTLFFLAMASCLCGIDNARAQQLAFPGADGYGKYVTGGRGGEVCYVTRLDDCSDTDLVPGTLRWALRHDNGGKPRTVLFSVSGTIYLTSKLKLQYPDVSILGQSAPGGGICVAGYNMYICRNNVIVRYIRFRAGDIPNSSMTGLDLENADNVIIDHCSMTWSMEECLTAYDTDYTTIQWCIIGEGLYNSKNSKGARAYATQWGGEHSTMHHSLITNSHSRAPRFNGVRSASTNKGEHDYQVDSEFANNVVYNWSGSGNQYGGEYAQSVVEAPAWAKIDPGYNRVYLFNNYYRPGPSTKNGTTGGRYFCSPSSPYGEWYLSGNKFETSSKWAPSATIWSDSELQKVNADNLYGAVENDASRGINLTGTNASTYIMKSVPYALSGMTYESADAAYQKVVTQAGASLPRYDEVDRRLLDEAAGKIDPQFAGPSITTDPGIIDSPDDIKLTEHDTYLVVGNIYTNYPFLGMRDGDMYAVDTDGDGMPDAYETEKGLNPNNAADGAAAAANGYTNLENYLNGIADGSINKAHYEKSTYPVIPGMPSAVTISYTDNVQTAKTVSMGAAVTLPATTTAGGTVKGWIGQSGYYEAGKAYTFTADITLTAVIEITFKDSDEPAVLTLIGSSVTLPEITKEGYIFQGWSDGSQTYPAGTTPTFSSSVTLNPVFKEAEGLSGSGKGNVAWPCAGSFDIKGTQEPLGMFSSATLELGKGLTFVPKTDKLTPKTSYAGVQPKEKSETPSEDAVIDLLLQPTAGLKFKLKNISFTTMRFGTGGGLIDVATKLGDAGEVVRKTGIKPNPETNPGLQVSIDVTDMKASDQPLRIRLYVYNLSITKQVGFNNIVVTGEWEGTSQAERFSFSAAASPTSAGTVTQNPSGSSFEPDTEIQLNATAADGYFFVNWTDNSGTVVSTQPSFTYTVKANTALKANFKSEADYAAIFQNCAPYDAAVDDVNGLKLALNAAAARADKTARYRIFLHNGTYDFGTTAKTAVVENTSLIGESMDGVMIKNNPGTVTSNYQEQTPVLFIDQNQNNVYMQDLTIRQARDWDEKKSQGQAIALRQRGKKAIYKNVAMQGVQDTYYLNKADASAYFENCHIAGETDFIYGDGTMFFQNCVLQPVSASACITASNAQTGYKGIVFNGCSIERRTDAKDAVTGYALGRPWGDSPAVTYINTTMKVQPQATGWRSMTSGLVVRFHEYGSKDENGNALDLSSRSISACSAAAGSDSPVITADEAATYTVENVFAKVASGWNPAADAAQLTPTTPSISGSTLSWQAVNGALGYAVVKNGKVVALTTLTSYAIDDASAAYAIRVANNMGGLSVPSAATSTGIENVVSDGDNAADSPMYNIAGQRVTSSAKGIVIINGKKYIRR